MATIRFEDVDVLTFDCYGTLIDWEAGILAGITNCDDDLFAASARRLGIAFDEVVTAQQVGAYKPSHRNFEMAFERLAVPRSRIVHVAQSLFHDHVPATELGLASAWIDRR